MSRGRWTNASRQRLADGASPALHRVCRWVGANLFPVLFRMRVHHAERVPRSGPVVLVSNHSSLVDGPILFGQLGRCSVFLIKREIFRGPVGWLLGRIGQLAVRRGEPDRTPLLVAVRVLRNGGLVGVFPEGGRGSGDVTNAEHGAAWLARTSGATVLPVACRGTRRPDGRRRFRPRVDVLFGEPLRLAGGRGRAGLTEATDQLRGELVGLVSELDRLRGDRHPGSDDVEGKA